MASLKDHTGKIPFILFGALAAFVIWVIIKNSPHYTPSKAASAK